MSSHNLLGFSRTSVVVSTLRSAMLPPLLLLLLYLSPSLLHPIEAVGDHSFSYLLRQQSNDSQGCTVTFSGKIVTFQACSLNPDSPLQLYYTLRGNVIDTVFRARRSDGMDYLAFGWGYSQMVEGDGSNVMVVVAPNDGVTQPTIASYLLTSKMSSGVTPGSADVTGQPQVDISDEFVAGRFSRFLDADTLPLLSPGPTSFIWSFGKVAQTPSLQQHAFESRGVGSVDLPLPLTDTPDSSPKPSTSLAASPQTSITPPMSTQPDQPTSPQPSTSLAASPQTSITPPVSTQPDQPTSQQTPSSSAVQSPVQSQTTMGCSVTFRGETLNFSSCDLTTYNPVQIYYTLNGDNLDTLFRAPLQQDMDYLAFGWGYTDMVIGDGSNVMVALTSADSNGGDPTIQNYALRSESTSGVAPGQAEYFDEQVELSDGVLAGRFSRSVNASGLPLINPGPNPFIWSWGSAAERPSLQQHVSRGVGELDVTADGNQQVSSSSESPSTANAETSSGKCDVTFLGEQLTFEKCDIEGLLVEVYFTINGEEIDTVFRTKRNSESQYAGFGWGHNRMVGGDGHDVMVVTVDSAGAGKISNYRLRAESEQGVQPADAQVRDAQVDTTNNYIAGRFKRNLDASGLPTLQTDVDTPYIWAVGSVKALPTLNEHNQYGVRSINLGTGVSTSSSGNGRERAHSVLMGVAWAVLAPYAVLAMRFFKRANPTTFQIHRALNTLVAIFTIIGFFLVVFTSGLGDRPHRFIGYVVFGLVILQTVGGYVRPAHESSTRFVWRLGHSVLGGASVVLGVVNIFLGIGLHEFDREDLWYALTAISVGIVGVAAIILSLLPQKFPVRPHHDHKNHDETHPSLEHPRSDNLEDGIPETL